jgi:hypothetical protein
VVPFGVENSRHLEYVARAIGHTQLATLAAPNYYVYLASWNDNPFVIKRFTPQFHGCFLLIDASRRSTMVVESWPNTTEN